MIKVIIASTVTEAPNEVSHEALSAIRMECLNKPFMHQGELYFITSAEEMQVAPGEGSFGEDRSLVVELCPVTEAREITVEPGQIPTRGRVSRTTLRVSCSSRC